MSKYIACYKYVPFRKVWDVLQSRKMIFHFNSEMTLRIVINFIAFWDLISVYIQLFQRTRFTIYLKAANFCIYWYNFNHHRLAETVCGFYVVIRKVRRQLDKYLFSTITELTNMFSNASQNSLGYSFNLAVNSTSKTCDYVCEYSVPGPIKCSF